MAAAAAAYPPWVMLEERSTRDSSIGDMRTLASCRTTSGHPISVSLCLAAPPEGSRVCIQLPVGVKVYGAVLAAHSDSVVVQVGIEFKNPGAIIATNITDHFVYSAGDAAVEPPRSPSLSLLAPHSITYEDKRHPECNFLDRTNSGLLCRGEGDFLVAELQMEYLMENGVPRHNVRKDAALHLLRSGSGEWYVKRPVISRYADGGECVDLELSWKNSTVIAVGDRMLCWVDLARGLLFSDELFDENPSLKYVPLPEDPSSGLRSVCVTAGGRMIKFVNIFSRCCCGGAGKSNCRGSHHAYAVHTWTLRMDDMTWAMDGRLDATQLWSLNAYKGLPRVELVNPVVSMDEADAICFEVCEKHHEQDGDKTMWRIMVDMKSKTLRSVFRYPEEGRWYSRWYRHLPSRVSKYFNSKPSNAQPGPASQMPEAMQNTTNRKFKNNKLQTVNSTMGATSPEASILAALQEIPGLGPEDMLKAYRILAHDNSSNRFRVLMGLPMDLRKDCVLMEIKASEACVLCCACSADLQCN